MKAVNKSAISATPLRINIPRHKARKPYCDGAFMSSLLPDSDLTFRLFSAIELGVLFWVSALLKPTSTLVGLHIEQGYLATARGLLDRLIELNPDDPRIAGLEQRWAHGAAAARRRASIELLRQLLARVRKVRTAQREV